MLSYLSILFLLVLFLLIVWLLMSINLEVYWVVGWVFWLYLLLIILGIILFVILGVSGIYMDSIVNSGWLVVVFLVVFGLVVVVSYLWLIICGI